MKESLDSKDLDGVAEHIKALEARLQRAEDIIRHLYESLDFISRRYDGWTGKLLAQNSLKEAQAFLAEGK